MKNFFAILLLILVSLNSCNKEKTSAETKAEVAQDTIAVAEKFGIDSIKISDSAKIVDNLTASFQAKLLVFPDIKDKSVLDSIYSPEGISAQNYSKDSLTKSIKLKQKQFFDETKKGSTDYKPEFKQTWTKNSNMSILSNKNNLLTLKYTGDGFTGGAHGYYYELYKVFDLKNNKTLHLSDILTEQDPKIWSRILMDNFLKNDLEKNQAEMLLVKEIPLNENFYFGEDNLYFLYNQYEITAYAAGTVLIKVPYSAIKPLLKSEFKTRLGL